MLCVVWVKSRQNAYLYNLFQAYNCFCLRSWVSFLLLKLNEITVFCHNSVSHNITRSLSLQVCVHISGEMDSFNTHFRINAAPCQFDGICKQFLKIQQKIFGTFISGHGT